MTEQKQMDLNNLGNFVDVSAVRTDVSMKEIDQLIKVVKEFKCICASPMPFVTKYVIDALADCPETVVTGVVSFPAGADTTAMKIFTAKEMIQQGCQELDMVMNVSALKSQNYEYVRDDIKAVVEAVGNIPVKVILEACYLTDSEICKASEIIVEAGGSYVKTGTGWGPKPTTVDTIRLIRNAIGNAAKIKAAGGIRNLDTILEMYQTGCDRFGIGVRSAISIFKEAYERSQKPFPQIFESL